MPTPLKLFSVCSGLLFCLGSCSTPFPAPAVPRVAVGSGEFILPDFREVFLKYEFLESALASYNIGVKGKLSFTFLYSVMTFCFTSGHQMCRGLPLTKQFSATPAECPTIQFTSDTIYLERASDPTDCSHFRCQLQVQVVTWTSD